MRFEHYMFSTRCRYFSKIAGNGFESTPRISKEMLRHILLNSLRSSAEDVRFGHSHGYFVSPSAYKLSHSLDPDYFGPKGPQSNLSNLTSLHNGEGRKCIHICGLPIAEDVRFEHYMFSTRCRSFFKRAGNGFESAPRISEEMLRHILPNSLRSSAEDVRFELTGRFTSRRFSKPLV